MAKTPTTVKKTSAKTPLRELTEATLKKGAPGKQPVTKTAIKPPPFRFDSKQKTTRYLKLLVYGNYGVGKTTVACSALDVPSMNDVVLLNAEAGDLAVDDEDDLEVITIRTFKTFASVHEYLRQHCKHRDAGDIEALRASEAHLKGVNPKSITKPRQFRTCILDTLTEIEAYCFDQLLGITDTTRIDEETDTAEWGEYKKNTLMIMRVIRRFRDLPMNVIFTCAERWIQDENKRFKFSPAMTGQLSKKIQGAMDMVGYYVVGKSKKDSVGIPRRLYVSPSGTGKYDAKHRYASFGGDHFNNPTIRSILTEVGFLDSKGKPKEVALK